MSEKIKNIIISLGFKPKNGEDLIYSKKYTDTEIKIKYNEKTPEKSTIDYGNIKCHRDTICNFTKPENVVHLECVTRLLNKGYMAQDIELEKPWQLGHKPGYLDILVKDKNNKSFLMIDVKHWDKYESTVQAATKNEKDQIFSYLQQEPKTTKAICYYTSRIENGQIIYKNAIVNNKEEWKDLNQEERFNQWSKTWESNGIFEDNIPLYNVNSKSILRKELTVLTKEDSDRLYKQFAEILRHNVISDKPNAFNKIINLFLCKIYDEDRNPSEEVKFQLKTLGRYKTNEELLDDLNDLYKAGMKEYFNYDISDYSKDEFETLLKFLGDDSKKQQFEDLYKTLRLYKNNEFAFKEVFDKKSFEDNAKVVKEVVEMLQNYQLRYTKKQQFLGDFYETLLNDSIKQEAGQFFTPVPLTQFIIKCLPIREIINSKIANGEKNILPLVVDYACGTGHFLTEIMEELDNIIKNDIDKTNLSPSLQRTVTSWQDDSFSWAKDYIYGIDLDYRLIKASKISCFLNGDGKANLIHANGLAPFDSQDYIGELYSDSLKQNNQKFDILIANPPYSVKEFGKHAIEKGKQCFELYSHLTEKCSAIECFFVERAKQLVKEGGYVGIVLPISLFTNNGIETKTREIILKYFDIKGILSLKDKAFMATGTKTVILIMQRRSNNYWELINQQVKNFISNNKDVTVAGIEKAFSKFVSITYEDITFDDYVKFLNGITSETIKNTDFYTDHKILSTKELQKLESDKMLYFFLSYNSKLVLANSGEKDDEKSFLGYEFKTSDNQKKINIHKDENNNIISSLFSDIDNLDNEKINTYIYKNSIGLDIENEIYKITSNEDNLLKGHIDYCRLSELIDFSLPKFEKNLNLNARKKIEFISSYPLVKIKRIDALDIKKGTSITEKEVNAGEVPVVAGGMQPAYFHNISNRNANVITISASGANAGYINFYDKPIWASDCTTIVSNNEDVIKINYLYEILKSVQNKIYYLQSGKSQPHFYPEDIYPIKIPVPGEKIQQKIIDEIKPLNNSLSSNIKSIDTKKQIIKNKYAYLHSLGKNHIRLSDKNIFDLSIGKRVLNKQLKQNGNIPVYSANVFKPFGYIDKLLFEDFNRPSVIWGIDGDWMVNSIDKNILFYPTDHCGILRLKKENIFIEKYVAYALQQAGIEYGFSRNKRASIDRIETIKIPIPDYSVQKDIIAEIIPLEKEVEKLQKEIEEIPTKKQAILDKYLK